MKNHSIQERMAKAKDIVQNKKNANIFKVPISFCWKCGIHLMSIHCHPKRYRVSMAILYQVEWKHRDGTTCPMYVNEYAHIHDMTEKRRLILWPKTKWCKSEKCLHHTSKNATDNNAARNVMENWCVPYVDRREKLPTIFTLIRFMQRKCCDKGAALAKCQSNSYIKHITGC